MNSIRSLASTAVLIALTLCASPNAHGTLHITEFMADNKNTLQDGDGDASDWIEIFNSGPQPVNMEGYFLTDEIDALTKWSFPSVEMVLFLEGTGRPRIEEVAAARQTERGNRADDKRSETAMEDRKKEGYF